MKTQRNANGEVKRGAITEDASFWLEALGIGEDISLMPGAIAEELYSLGFAKISINAAGRAFLESHGWKFL